MAKWGAGAPAAYFRQGLAEIRAAASFEGSIAQPVDAGMWGKATMQEVFEVRTGEVEADGPTPAVPTDAAQAAADPGVTPDRPAGRGAER